MENKENSRLDNILNSTRADYIDESQIKIHKLLRESQQTKKQLRLQTNKAKLYLTGLIMAGTISAHGYSSFSYNSKNITTIEELISHNHHLVLSNLLPGDENKNDIFLDTIGLDSEYLKEILDLKHKITMLNTVDNVDDIDRDHLKTMLYTIERLQLDTIKTKLLNLYDLDDKNKITLSPATLNSRDIITIDQIHYEGDKSLNAYISTICDNQTMQNDFDRFNNKKILAASAKYITSLEQMAVTSLEQTTYTNNQNSISTTTLRTDDER